jgi:serine/threonine-protein kinase
LAVQLRAEQRQRWRAGERVPAESYLERYPALRADPDTAVDLVYNEFLLREQLGECPDPEEFFRRFPEYAAVLGLQIEMHRALADQATGPLEQPRNAEAGALPRVPGYELLGELGRGGMGVVYKARQVALNRVVALKVILAGGHANPEQRRRFQVEAEAAARLRHPNVVQVHDYGVHDGHAYLALEYVEGGTLAQKTAGNPQPPVEAARVVEVLALAVQQAHAAGLVHRDLKPTNVLLSADGVLKVADFGLVKRLDATSAQTGSGDIMGTPSYMAPEQAGSQGGPVGPAADVYALGAILYELLTGRPPFQSSTPLDTVLQVVRDEPVPPRRLRPKVPRDLETICLKCLRKEPGGRYATAQDLAEELRRFQAGEPIAARPIGRLGRAWRRCRRNPVVSTLTALLTLALVGGLISVTALWWRAESSRQAAVDNLAEAEANFQLALEAVDQFCTRVSEDQRLQEHDLRRLRRQLLQTAVDFHHRFVAKHGDDNRLRAGLARAYFRLGRLTAEIDAKPKARAFYKEALSRFELLAGEHPGEAAYRHELAECYRNIALLDEETGQVREAEAALRKAEEITRGLVQDHPHHPTYLRQLVEVHAGLGGLYRRHSRTAEAEGPLQEALAGAETLARRHPEVAAYRLDLARQQQNLGQLYQYYLIHRWREAEPRYRAARDLLTELRAGDPGSADYQAALASLLRDQGNLHYLANRWEEAAATFREAISVLQGLVREHASVTGYQARLAQLEDNLCTAYERAGRLADAEASSRNALRIWERLTVLDPESVSHATRLGSCQQQIGILIRDQGDATGALEWLARAIRTLEGARRQSPENDNARGFLSAAHRERARTLVALGRHAEALPDQDRAVELAQPLLRPHMRVQRALTRARLGDHAAAVEEARQVTDHLPATGRGTGMSYADAARVHAVAAGAVLRDTRLAEGDRGRLAEEYTAASVQLLQRAVQAGYREPANWRKAREFEALRDRPDFQKVLDEASRSPGS